MNLSRRTVLVSGLVATLFSSVAFAAAKSPFTQSSFEAANKAGKPILVEVTAPWCPTCKAQAPILGELGSQTRFKDLQTFTVDFDSQKDVLKTLNVQMQSTLIVFNGKTEKGRSAGVTDPAEIKALLLKSKS